MCWGRRVPLPVSGESLDMPGVEAVAERMGHDVVGHHPLMPGVSKTAQAFIATRCLEDSLHVTHDDNHFVLMQERRRRVHRGREIRWGTTYGSRPVTHRLEMDVSGFRQITGYSEVSDTLTEKSPAVFTSGVSVFHVFRGTKAVL